MSTLLLADGNWLLHRAVSVAARPGAQSYERRAATLVLGWVSSYALKFNSTHAAVCFDGHSNFRYAVYPEYKANRGGSSNASTDEPITYDDSNDSRSNASPKDNVYAALPYVIDLFRKVGMPLFQLDEYEADDLLASGSKHWSSLSPSNSTVLACRDKDLLQCVTKRVRVYTPAVYNQPEVIHDHASVTASRGLSPRQFADYQILIGDSIDNVPSILTPKRAMQVLSDHGSLKSWFQTEDGASFFRKHHLALLRNQSLVRLHSSCWSPDPLSLSVPHLAKGDADAVSNFGSLPKSFVSLRSLSSPKTALF